MEIRESMLLSFFKKAERYSKCPFCPHDGAWAMHLAEDDQGSSYPHGYDHALYIHKLGPVSAVALSCPNCGHLSMVSTMVITGELAKATGNG